MRTHTLQGPPRLVAPGRPALIAGAAGALTCVLALVASRAVEHESLATKLAVVGVPLIAGVLVVSRRYEITLAVVALYIGLFDGFIKLHTGSHAATLGRDLLFYAVVVGATVRLLTSRAPIEIPPLTGWIVAFLAVTVAQLPNPANGGLTASLGSLRPHLEWVPLFFFGYSVMRSERRLMGYALILVLIANINGVVSLIQASLGPSGLAAWGPGYAKLVAIGQELSARIYYDAAGHKHLRPPALGGDLGFGAYAAMLAAPAALAIVVLQRNIVRAGALAVATLPGIVLGLATGQARLAIIASGVGLLAFLLLTGLSGRARAALIALGVTALLAVVAVSLIRQHQGSVAFERYQGLAPSTLLSTATSARAGSLALLPGYAARYPLGAGLGVAGPASQLGNVRNAGLNAETEFNYLLLELGLPGLLLLTAFMIRLLAVTVTRLRRVPELRLRIILAGLLAAMFALAVSWLAAPTTASTPSAPYFWFSTGIIAYWLAGPPASDRAQGGSARATPHLHGAGGVRT